MTIDDRQNEPPPPARGRRLEHLDMLRGAAAMLVMLGHARAFVFIDASQQSGIGPAAKIFYAATGFGHQAVILFFALSGFLVGGRALREIAQGRWNAPDYTVHRFARLWTVLVPALLLTALLDWIGRDWLRLAGYDGQYFALLANGPSGPGHYSADAATFVGNVAFLQTIAVPVFGINGPLWSLANEFWYYAVVPLAWLSVAGKANSAKQRIAAALFTVAALLLLPVPLLALGTIWIIGAVAWIAGDRVRSLGRTGFRMLFVAALAAIVAGLAASRLIAGLPGDLLLGGAVAVALPCLARLPNLGGLYGRVAFWISEVSFTLYVVHFPVLALLWFTLIAPAQFVVGLTGLVPFTALSGAAMLCTVIMWWLFERNTPSVRGWMMRTLRITR